MERINSANPKKHAGRYEVTDALDAFRKLYNKKDPEGCEYYLPQEELDKSYHEQ